MSSLVLIAVLRSTLRQSTPITLGALSGLFCERVGVINIAIEGMMLTAAYMGYMTNVWTGNLILAVIVAVLSGGLMGPPQAWASMQF